MAGGMAGGREEGWEGWGERWEMDGRKNGGGVAGRIGGGWEEGWEERWEEGWGDAVRKERRRYSTKGGSPPTHRWSLWGGRSPEECPIRPCLRPTPPHPSPVVLLGGRVLAAVLRKERLNTVHSLPSAVSPSLRLKKPPCPGSCQFLKQSTPSELIHTREGRLGVSFLQPKSLQPNSQAH